MCTPFCKSLLVHLLVRPSVHYFFTIWSTLCSNPIFFYPPLQQFDQHFVQMPFLLQFNLHFIQAPIFFSIFLTWSISPLVCWSVNPSISPSVRLSLIGWSTWLMAISLILLWYDLHFVQTPFFFNPFFLQTDIHFVQTPFFSSLSFTIWSKIC